MEQAEERKALDDWVEVARQRLPALGVRVARGGLVLEWKGERARIPRARIGRFDRGEISQIEREGGSFLDLKSGLLHVEDDGLLLHLQIQVAATKLTPFLCAVLALILQQRIMPDGELGGTGGRGLPLFGKQTLLAKEWSRALCTEISPMAIHRLFKSLRMAALLNEDLRDTDELDLLGCIQLLRKDFRLSSVGQGEFYCALPGELGLLERELGSGFAWGVSQTLSLFGGGWVEPRDVLVDPTYLSEVRKLLGPRMTGSAAPAVLVRPTRRVGLSLLCMELPRLSDEAFLNPLLAACEAMNSEDPVQREIGTRLWSRWSEA